MNTSNPDFIIRPGEKNDAPIVLDFIKKLAEYEKMSDQVYATIDSVEKTLFSETPSAETLLGFYKNEPVAFAIYFYNYSTFLGAPGLYLEDLFVVPEMRGNGFGKEMLIQLTKIAADRNCGRMEWSVLNWNEPAINFYKSLGAVPIDKWTVYRLDKATLIKLSGK